MDRRSTHERFNVRRIQRDCARKVPKSLGESSVSRQERPAIVQGRRKVGIDAQRLVVVGDRLLVHAELLVRERAIVVHQARRLLGLEPYRLVVVDDRLLVSSRASVAVASISVRLGEQGIELDRLRVAIDRLVEFARGTERFTLIGEC